MKNHLSISGIREEYSSRELNESSIAANPFYQFQFWLEEAIKSKVNEPTAMNLATVDKRNRPKSRIVLLKDFSQEGFVFFTNYQSQKGNDLAHNPFGSINFFWPELERQVRIEGMISKVNTSQSDEYFASRPRGSQIGANVSPQSKIINKSELENRVRNFEVSNEGKIIDRPENWGGYILKPDYFEFWQGRPSRLHDRLTFLFENNEWLINRIAP
jgi:pyridoxamine 5'-phosphate oxidase